MIAAGGFVSSHFVLAILALAALLVHIVSGGSGAALTRALPIVAGVLIGAQAGAPLSSRIRARWILRALGLGLVAVGARLLVPH